MGSKTIVLINIPKEIEKTTTPLGVLYVGGALKKKGYEVKVFHFTMKDKEEYLKKILEIDPLFVGFSVITGSKTMASAIMSREIKKRKDIPIVWGGVHPSLLPEQTIGEKYVDYIVVGEGEKTIVELANAIEGKRKFSGVKGIAYKEKGKVKFSKPRPLMSSEEIDQYSPDRSLLDMNDFFINMWGCKRVLNIQTSRGCVYNCRFCYNLHFNQRKWRPRSVENVMKEINELKEKYDIDGIEFVDDFLFADVNRAIDILEKTDLPWFGEMRINQINEELVEKLAKTKARQILFGFESGSNEILKRVNKGFTVNTIKRGVKLLSKYKELRLSASFIMGLPGETKEDLKKTVDLILELIKIHPEMRYSFGIYLPYPGSDTFREAVEAGFVPPKKTEDWSILDRASYSLKLVWIDWMQNPEYYQRLRSYAQLLPLAQYNFPYIKNIPEKRLRKMDFSHSLELKFLTSLQQKFAMQRHFFRKFGQKVLPFFKKN